MWTSKKDAIAAADAFVERVEHLEVPTWSNRELQLEAAAAPLATEMRRLDWVHPYCLAVYARLRERVDPRTYSQLTQAITQMAGRQESAKLFPWKPEGVAD